MRKGKHRRHQSARDLKRGVGVSADIGVSINAVLDHHLDTEESGLAVLSGEQTLDATPGTECDECRRWPHAEWCLADEDDEE